MVVWYAVGQGAGRGAVKVHATHRVRVAGLASGGGGGGGGGVKCSLSSDTPIATDVGRDASAVHAPHRVRVAGLTNQCSGGYPRWH